MATRTIPVPFNGVKIFSATMVADRERLGEKVSSWIAENPRFQVADMVVTQSSDDAFHCIAISVFYFEQLTRK
jgi:hypothetical protein